MMGQGVGIEYTYDPELNCGKTLAEALSGTSHIGYVNMHGEQLYLKPSEARRRWD